MRRKKPLETMLRRLAIKRGNDRRDHHEADNDPHRRQGDDTQRQRARGGDEAEGGQGQGLSFSEWFSFDGISAKRSRGSRLVSLRFTRTSP
ncbi:hypothetical protein GCM10011491_22190 [Brucella endophytica]|uniref:Uncharacterized protein n=1 Tax=Brucella endophytica TaxID=1963359 RepID=A0A916SCH4_9HYPH|nr:hypothetical protein GCM10011491_22190 [Brucella endophytica]